MRYIAEKVLPLAQRQLVAYQFGDPLTLPEHRGTVYTATRYNRVPLPYAPISEGVPPVGQTMSITQVSATAQQWGDKITITDVADLTIFHPVFQQATKLLAMQQSETVERNTFNNLMAGTQVNYVNSRGSRGALVAGDVLDSTTINRTVGNLVTLGAPMYMGDEGEDVTRSVEDGAAPKRLQQSPPHAALRGDHPSRWSWSTSAPTATCVWPGPIRTSTASTTPRRASGLACASARATWCRPSPGSP